MPLTVGKELSPHKLVVGFIEVLLAEDPQLAPTPALIVTVTAEAETSSYPSLTYKVQVSVPAVAGALYVGFKTVLLLKRKPLPVLVQAHA